MSNSLADLSVSQLKRAIAIKERIEELQKELAGILGSPEPTAAGGVVRRRRKMSAAGRAKISAAAKARWAKVNAGKATAAKPVKKKNKMSAAGLANIKAAQKARWAKIKAAKK